MRIFNFLLFENTVAVPVGASSLQIVTDPEFNGLLGAADQLALLVNIDQIASTSDTQCYVIVEESADNIVWRQKNGFIHGVGADMAFVVPPNSGPTEGVYRDAGTQPSLGCIRLRLFLTTGPAESFTGRLRMWVTGRALGPGAPAQLKASPFLAAPGAIQPLQAAPPNCQQNQFGRAASQLMPHAQTTGKLTTLTASSMSEVARTSFARKP
jgi:hypothetical protein